MITSTACRETDDAGLKKGGRIRSRQTIFFVRSFESRGERSRDATNREETRVSLEKARGLDALKMNAPSRPVENRPKREREREREGAGRGGSWRRRDEEERTTGSVRRDNPFHDGSRARRAVRGAGTAMHGDRLDGGKSPMDGTGPRGFEALEMWRIVGGPRRWSATLPSYDSLRSANTMEPVEKGATYSE